MLMKLRYYVLLAVFSCLFFVVALFPAGLAYDLMPKSVVQGLPVSIQTVGGTVWDGFAVGKVRRGPVKGQHMVAWDMNLLRLLIADVSADLKVEGADFKVEGMAHTGFFGKGFSGLNGQVDASLVNGMLKQFGAQVVGELLIKDMMLEFGDENIIEEASGQLNWEGGPVSYKDGRRTRSVELPPIQGVLAEQDGGMQLAVVEKKSKKRLGQLTLKGSIGGVVVYNRVMTITDMGNPANEDEVLIQLQRPVF
ncbi:MAG: hypothetical protein CSA49_00020 [Gammaproteobacteria bacterium]|nr:MAG: hypothetical protein CSA49_00020 [Gammaproteobacteria bacterium]